MTDLKHCTERSPEIRLRGMSVAITRSQAQNSIICQKFWRTFNAALAASGLTQKGNWRKFAVTYSNAGTHRYFCGIVEHSNAPYPETFESFTIPAQNYLVFEHEGPMIGLGATLSTIYRRMFPNPTIRDILGSHAYDEAWVPAVIAGRSVVDGDEWVGRDLLGDDPIAAYGALNDTATGAVRAGVDPESTFRFQYGDYPAKEGFAHLAMYRAFQAWLIAQHFSIPFHLSPELVAGMNEHVVPDAELWRGFGVFPPAIDPPADADDETRLLCTLGYWIP